MNNSVVSHKSLDLYPIDYPFETLIGRIKKGKLRLNPEFQRKYKWDKEGWQRASRFIESCLMRIPLPSCYFAEDQEGNHFVIDGVQRLTTVNRFFADEFPLEELTAFKDLEGKYFSQLGDYQSELENTTIRCIILRKTNPQYLVREIFSRLNQGAVQLSSQEIRHALYGGPFDDLLTELAERDEIKNFKLGKSGQSKKDSLEAEEQVLRYFALRDSLDVYQGRLSKYLDEYMERKQNISEQEINEFREEFHQTLDKCVAVFGDTVFVNTTKKRTRQSIIYYDLLMHSFRTRSKKSLTSKKNVIQSKFQELCQEPEFRSSINSGSQNKNSILRRRKMWEEKLEEVYSDE